MEGSHANRMSRVHRSFIREILKVTADPSVISFAGGLPYPGLFPVGDYEKAACAVLGGDQGAQSLQYSTTEGFPPLREFIVRRYREKRGLDVDADDIIITNGSQQCLDLIAKILIDPGDKVVVERPGYLGAIQAFSMFEPEFVTVALQHDGPDLDELEAVFAAGGVKLFYAVPNFQNPSGLSYSPEKRKAVAELCLRYRIVFVEDDPYGELRYVGEHLPPVNTYLEGRGFLLGSFSKVGAPGFRIGWIVARGDSRDKLIVAKQATDLHTSSFGQRVVTQYLQDNDLDAHIGRILEKYGRHREVMIKKIDECFPHEISFTRPEGGMFLWVSLPEPFRAMDLFDRAIERKVAFVPGKPFYVDGGGEGAMRLNFSNAEEDMIEEGIARLGSCIEEFLGAGN